MNLKKIISAVTAFALSATMFAGFSVNANAADVTTVLTQDFSSTTLVDGDTYTYGTDLNITSDGVISMTNSNSTANNYTKDLVTFTNGIGDADTAVNVSYTMTTTKGKGQTATNFETIYLDENDTEIFRVTKAVGNSWTDVATLKTSSDSATLSDSTNLSVQIIFNGTAGGNVKSETANLTFTTGTKLSKIQIAVSGAQDYSRPVNFDNLTVSTQEAPKVVSYTVNYVDTNNENTVVKTSTESGVVGDVPVATMDDFDVDGQRYICDSNDASSKTIASEGTTVVTVNCHAANIYEMKAVTSSGDTIKSANVTEHDTFTYSFSKYLTDDNGKVTYTADDTTYTVTTTPTKSETITVPYTAYTGTAYFVEAESVLTGTDVQQKLLSGGNAKRGFAENSEVITVAEDGIYTVVAIGCSNNTNKNDVTLTINSKRGSESTLIAEHTLETSYNYPAECKTENVALKVGDVITVTGSTTNAIVDYVLIEKTAELPTVTTGVASTVDGTSFPTLTGSEEFINAADAEDKATYSDLTTGKTVKTVYAKVANSESAPVIKIGDAEQTSKWTAVGTTGIYFAQFVGTEADFAEGGAFETVTITCGTATPVTVNWAE